jgi:Phage integrase family
VRPELPVGPLLCVINGPRGGRHWSSAAARADLRRTAVRSGVGRRFAPRHLRHAHAVELAREGVPLVVIQHQLGHSNLGITSISLQGFWAPMLCLCKAQERRPTRILLVPRRAPDLTAVALAFQRRSGGCPG